MDPDSLNHIHCFGDFINDSGCVKISLFQRNCYRKCRQSAESKGGGMLHI